MRLQLELVISKQSFCWSAKFGVSYSVLWSFLIGHCILFFFFSVKQAITKKEETLTQMKEQYEKAVKRADHLEDLLEQQRKQLLGRK